MKKDKEIKFVFWENKLVKPLWRLQKKMKKQSYKNIEWKGTNHRAVGKS